jgi:Secretion system C-terminal sorting domain
MKQILSLYVFLVLAISNGYAQIHWGTLVIENQWQLDALPKYDSIAGSVIIGKLPPAISDVHDLSKLKHIKTIKDDLIIVSTSLTDLRGLDSLIDVGYRTIEVSENPYLKSLDGLGGIEFDHKNSCCEFLVKENPQLERLTSFVRLDTSYRQLELKDCPKLATLEGMESFEAFSIQIDKGKFRSLKGLENIKRTGIHILNADSLVSIRHLRPKATPYNYNNSWSSAISISNCKSLKSLDYHLTDTIIDAQIGIAGNLRDTARFECHLQNVSLGFYIMNDLKSIELRSVDTLRRLAIIDNPLIESLYFDKIRTCAELNVKGNNSLLTIYMTGGDPIFEPADTIVDLFNNKQLDGLISVWDNPKLTSISLPDFNTRGSSGLNLYDNRQLERFYAPKFSPNLGISITGNNLKKLELPAIQGDLLNYVRIHQSTDTIYPYFVKSTNEMDTIIGVGNYSSCRVDEYGRGGDIEIFTHTRHMPDFEQTYINELDLRGLKVEQLRFPNLKRFGRSANFGDLSMLNLNQLKHAPVFLSLEQNQELTIFASNCPFTSLDSLSTIHVDSIRLSLANVPINDCDVLCDWRSQGYFVEYETYNTSSPCDSLSNAYKFCTISTAETERAPVLVYPNPATTHITIEHSEHKQITHLWLINAQGQVVRWLDPAQEVTQIPVSGLPKGLYIIFGRDLFGTTFQKKIVISGQ